MWLFLAVANVSIWKVTKGKLIFFIHIAMANDFMYGVPPRHTHGENRVNKPWWHIGPFLSKYYDQGILIFL